MGFGIGILIAVVYWALLIGGDALGRRLGWSPFWSMWLPNALVLAFGVALWMARLKAR
jgi:lipopolysaccharide export system permease protein